MKEYLTADDRCGFGALSAHDLARLKQRHAKLRRLVRQRRAENRARIDGLLADVAADADLRAVTDGMMVLLGSRKHNRGDWRMRRELKQLRAAIDRLRAPAAGPNPVVQYDAPPDDAAVV